MKKWLEFITEGLEENPDDYLNELKDISTDIASNFDVDIKINKFPFFKIIITSSSQAVKFYRSGKANGTNDEQKLKEFYDNAIGHNLLVSGGVDFTKRLTSHGWIIESFEIEDSYRKDGNVMEPPEYWSRIVIEVVANINDIDSDMDEVVKIIQPLLVGIPFDDNSTENVLGKGPHWNYSYNTRGQRSMINIMNIRDKSLFRKIKSKEEEIKKVTKRFKSIFKDDFREGLPSSYCDIFINLD